MADEQTAAPSAADGTAAPSAQPQQAEPSVNLSPSKLKERLDETREATRRELLREFGFESLSDGKKSLDALRAIQKSQMSEQERLAADLKEATSKAKRAEHLEKLFASVIDDQFNSLSDSVREAIDAEANGDPQERYRLMAFMKKAGVIGGAQPQSATPPPGAVPKPASNGAAPPAPKSATTRTKYEEFRELEQRNPIAATIFYQANLKEIEATRRSQ